MANPASTLLRDHAQRLARRDAKRHAVLRFLRQEIYSTAQILQQLLGARALQGVHRTLQSMERDGLLVSEIVTTPAGRQIQLWGITPHGQGLTTNFDAGETLPDRAYERGRVGLTVLQHTLDIQAIRIKCEQGGWTDWQAGDHLGKWTAGIGRPDAIAQDPSGVRWAVEIERSIKTRKRYESILADRLKAIHSGRFDRCAWLSPDPKIRRIVEATILGIDSVPVAGRRERVESRHHEKLLFACYEEFPR